VGGVRDLEEDIPEERALGARWVGDRSEEGDNDEAFFSQATYGGGGGGGSRKGIYIHMGMATCTPCVWMCLDVYAHGSFVYADVCGYMYMDDLCV
jgi:hypothetical protein